jgi:hypothetical protein
MDIFQNRLETEIQRMLNEPVSPSRGVNQLSNFGLKYNFTFSDKEMDENGRLLSMVPISPTYSEENYDLYSTLICPYTSGEVRTEIQESDMLFFAPESFRIEGNTLHITDVLWPQVYSASPLDLEIIEYLIKTSYVPYQKLLFDFGGVACHDDIYSCLLTLIAKGVVVNSSRM